MLFELRPDIFPDQRLTDTESILWGKYLERKNEIMNGRP